MSIHTYTYNTCYTCNTYRYIQYIHIHAIHAIHAIHTHIHTHTYTHTPSNQCRKGLLSCCSGSTRRLCDALPTQIISDGARGRLAEREMRVECLLAAQGEHFGPPNACCARGCAKTSPGVGPRWREKVVGHLPRDALSGARGLPLQRGVFRGRCDGIRACLGQYIPYIQHTYTYMQYMQYMQYMHICIENKYIHDTYNTNTHAFSEHLVRNACMCMYCNAYVYV